MQCQEGIKEPTHIFTDRRTALLEKSIDRVLIFPLRGAGVFSTDIFDRIEEYAARDISRNSDSLNGILGIFEFFRKMKSTVYQLWGLPILLLETFEVEWVYAPRTLANRFAWALTWTVSPGERCTFHSSWSWVGWKMPNEVTFPILNTNKRKTVRWGSIKFGIEIKVQLQNDKVVTLEELFNPVVSHSYYPTRFLIVDAWIVSIRFEYKALQEPERVTYETEGGRIMEYLVYPKHLYNHLNQGLWTKVEGCSTLHSFRQKRKAVNKSTFHSLLPEKSWYGMVLTFYDDPDYERWKTVILLHREGHLYERIGTIDNVDCKRFF